LRLRKRSLANESHSANAHLRRGLNVHEGKITHRAVAEALKLKFIPPEAALRL